MASDLDHKGLSDSEIVFRLGIIGMIKRILDSMIRIIGKKF